MSADACSAPQYNGVESSYGCTAADICPASVYTALAAVRTAPVLSLDAANVTLDQCSSGPLLLTFANTGARTGAVVVTYTLPAGYEYTGLAAGTTPSPELQPLLGTEGELVFGYAAIGQQQVTNTLRISVTRDLAHRGVSQHCYGDRQAWLCRHLRHLERRRGAGHRQADRCCAWTCPALRRRPCRRR